MLPYTMTVMRGCHFAAYRNRPSPGHWQSTRSDLGRGQVAAEYVSATCVTGPQRSVTAPGEALWSHTNDRPATRAGWPALIAAGVTSGLRIRVFAQKGSTKFPK
jgi:hypothetical protein